MHSDRGKPVDPMGETVSDNGSVPVRRRPKLDELVRAKQEPEDLQFGRDLLDETVSDLDAVEPSDDEVQLDKILDRPQSATDVSLTRYDPEAGRMDVAVKIKAATEAVKNTIKSPFGKLLLVVPIFLVGVWLAIEAVTYQTWAWIGPAAVVFPLGSVLVYIRYQAWLGSKRYMYRLLESLGEDVSDFDYRQQLRRVGKPVKARR
jgi:hypothetical protein